MHNRRLCILAVLLVACVASYMLVGARGNWSFVLPFRGNKLAVLMLVGVAVSTATVLFQTITQNRILTPAIMGFDALYVLILTASVFILGQDNYGRLPDVAQFGVNTALMLGVSLALFGTLLLTARGDLIRMVLTGIILATLFRAGTNFIQRMIDPNEFSIIQVNSYARFVRVDALLLGIAAALACFALVLAWRMRHRLDVLALGPDMATNLGEAPRRGMIEALVLIAVLVAVSTALVGPLAFLGLIVVSIAHRITPTEAHRILLVSSALVSCCALVGGQLVLERILSLSTPLVVVVDVLGGLLFMVLLLRKRYR